MLQGIIPKKRLLTEIKRFIKDQDRGISIKLFAELCGMDKSHLMDVFFHRTHPLTEYIQIRVSRGYEAWKRGEVAVMQNQNNTRFVQYRRKPMPRVTNGSSLQLVNGAIKIRMGMRNLGDYSQPDLDEQLRG